jgi:very-short-patch-repair endonuclease
MTQKTKLLRCAKILRKKSTPVEKVLWQAIRNRQLKGLKFRRQYWVNNLEKVLQKIAENINV